MPPVYFDDSLPRFAALVETQWGEAALTNNLFLRDASGRLTFIVLDARFARDARQTLAQQAEQLLPYVDQGGFAVATPTQLFDERLSNLASALTIKLQTADFSGNVHLIDRRMVGADWLLPPVLLIPQPLRIVFASIKGGVGRSTALCVVAAHLAKQGQRVLALDMDLEAPGLGNMLLTADTLPEFGLLDFLVEQGLGPLEQSFFQEMIAPSWLGGGSGKVDVIPAIGSRSLKHPANVLGKIARAYLTAGPADEQGEMAGFGMHMRQLLEQVADPMRYDVVLIDARAGLHETSAAAIIGMGAEVLLFGLDQPQTIAGYELLLAHLATLPAPSHAEDADDWRDRLHFIQAKASASPDLRQKFASEMRALVRQHLWPTTQGTPDLADLRDSFNAEWDDNARADEILHEHEVNVTPVLNSEHYYAFDPLAKRDILLERVYRDSFGELLQLIEDLLDTNTNTEA